MHRSVGGSRSDGCRVDGEAANLHRCQNGADVAWAKQSDEGGDDAGTGVGAISRIQRLAFCYRPFYPDGSLLFGGLREANEKLLAGQPRLFFCNDAVEVGRLHLLVPAGLKTHDSRCRVTYRMGSL